MCRSAISSCSGAVSNIGGQLTAVALPAPVVILLGATPLQAGALQAVECGIIPLLAMVAGVFVDRFSRRPMMTGADLVRGSALVSLPLAFALHHATLGQFFVVSLVVGLASVVFDSARVAFFPALVPREQIAEGNAKMSMGSSGAEAACASLGGLAVSALGAPMSIGFTRFRCIAARTENGRGRTPARSGAARDRDHQRDESFGRCDRDVGLYIFLYRRGPIFAVNQQTIRVSLMPPELLGRMSATNRTLVWGMLPIGRSWAARSRWVPHSGCRVVPTWYSIRQACPLSRS